MEIACLIVFLLTKQVVSFQITKPTTHNNVHLDRKSQQHNKISRSEIALRAIGGAEESILANNNEPSVSLPPNNNNKKPPLRGVLFVDPFSDFHGLHMIDLAQQIYGAGVVHVISPYQATGLNRTSTDDDEDYTRYVAPLDEKELAAWLDKVPFDITAVVCESDSGLDYSEKLAEAISKTVPDLKHNGYNAGRRDKFAMNRICQQRGGCQTATQVLCGSVDEALSNAATLGCTNDIENSKPVVIKPKRGVASDRVVLCQTLHDIPKATEDIMNSNVFGQFDVRHDSVLMQEYVSGKEYAVDIVSKNGLHKTAAVWFYEKTCTSDDTSRPFAYLSTRLAPSEDPNIDKVVSYVEACLDALDIRWGMTHTEVKVDDSGEVKLIEVNVRQHNDHFAPICHACIGYNAMDLCLSAYLDDDESNLFDSVPRRPVPRRSGTIVNLACFVEGIVLEVRHLRDIEALESFVAMELFPAFSVGNRIGITKDIRSDCGWVHLVNEDEDRLERDYRRIRGWMKTMFRVE